MSEDARKGKRLYRQMMGLQEDEIAQVTILEVNEGIQQSTQAGKPSSILQKFDECQLESLSEHLSVLHTYCFLLSREIKHQESSINTLPSSIIQLYPELRHRKNYMIERGRFNLKFIEILLQPYKILTSKTHQNSSKDHVSTGHSIGHTHTHQNPSHITDMFYHISSQWGPEAQIDHIDKAINLCQKYWQDIVNQSQNSQKGQRVQALVVGCGMGRILYDFKQRFKDKGINLLLQGHETDTENYICAQYFLNRCQQRCSIYPFIHNFSNYLKNDSAYREVKVPFQIEDHSYFYPLTWGAFPQLYRSHQEQWNCIISFFENYHIEDILGYIRLIYNMLRIGGVWIDLSTSNFSRNLVPMAFKEYENVLNKSQFQLLEKGQFQHLWYHDRDCIMNERRKCYYRVMRK